VSEEPGLRADLPRADLSRVDLPRVDLHSHAGRCFLAGLPAGHPAAATLGAASVADAVRAARAAGVTALCLSAVADFVVLRPDPATGLRAHRDFRAGEAYADYRRQLAGIREAVAAADAEVATSAADLDRAARDGRTAVLLGCEGGDFLGGTCGGWNKPARPASRCSPWCTTGSTRSATCRPRRRCTTA
jgi:hypothetical protein